MLPEDEKRKLVQSREGSSQYADGGIVPLNQLTRPIGYR